jgi:hypothetical protein
MREVHCGVPRSSAHGFSSHPPHTPSSTRGCRERAPFRIHLGMRLLPDVYDALPEIG